MIKYLILIILLWTFLGCTVKAYKDGDTLIGKGFGFKKATWPEGYSLEKAEPVKVPDIVFPE